MPAPFCFGSRIRPRGGRKGRRPGAQLLLLGAAIALAAGMTARAQAPGLKHDWEAKHDIRAPHLKVGKNPKQAPAAEGLISLQLKEGGDAEAMRERAGSGALL